MTCLDLIAEMDREAEPGIVPKVIGGFVDQTFLFKIDVKSNVNSGFEQSFRVKKVCVDQHIITKFKSVAKTSIGVDDSLSNNQVQSELANGVVRDLSTKFDSVGAEDKSEGNYVVSIDIDSSSADLTHVKRGMVQVAGDDDEAVTRILKTIKIEKE
ncbi:hypothetical protein RYX36_012853 [Vicia faba]